MSTTGKYKGNTIEIVREHVLEPEYMYESRNCSACIEEGMKRKPAEVVKTKDNKNSFINKYNTGYPT